MSVDDRALIEDLRQDMRLVLWSCLYVSSSRALRWTISEDRIFVRQ